MDEKEKRISETHQLTEHERSFRLINNENVRQDENKNLLSSTQFPISIPSPALSLCLCSLSLLLYQSHPALSLPLSILPLSTLPLFYQYHPPSSLLSPCLLHQPTSPCFLVTNVPALVKPPSAFFTQMLSKDSLESSHATWCLDVSNHTHNHQWWSFNDSHGLNHFLFVTLCQR